jgi:hypothetical protein
VVGSRLAVGVLCRPRQEVIDECHSSGSVDPAARGPRLSRTDRLVSVLIMEEHWESSGIEPGRVRSQNGPVTISAHGLDRPQPALKREGH